VGGRLSTYWIYLVGPIVGATIAVGFEYILKGRATVAGAEAAQGALGADDTASIRPRSLLRPKHDRSRGG